jgi:hypothetical protein
MQGNCRFFLPFIAILGYSMAGSANPWLQKPGHGIAILAYTQYETSHYFSANGDRTSQPRFAKRELNPYIEYGWSDDWTLGGSLFLQHLEQVDASGTTQENWGLGNSELFARRHLWSGDKASFSADALLALPATYEIDAEPRAGRNDYDIAFALNGGTGYHLLGRDHFAAVRAMYRHRLGLLQDQVQLEARTGFSVGDDWMIMPELLWTLPVQGVSAVTRSVAGQNDYRLLKGQLSAVYALDEHNRLQAGLFRHLDGADTGGGGGVLLSVWRNF